MNELNKLIEQINADIKEELKFDTHPSEKDWNMGKGILLTIEEVQLLIKFATRPSCGEEQRKFLDEVISNHSTVWFTEDKLAAVKIFDNNKNKLEPLYLNQADFESDLKKVFKGD